MFSGNWVFRVNYIGFLSYCVMLIILIIGDILMWKCKKYQEKEEIWYFDLFEGLVNIVVNNWVFVECFIGVYRLVKVGVKNGCC